MKAGDAESAIRRIVAGQVTAWNAGDAAGYARPFAADGSFTNIYGQHHSGREAFEARHARIFATFFRGSTIAVTIRELRSLGDCAALAELDTEVRGAQGMPSGARPGADGVLRTRLLQVFECRAGVWLIVVHHNVAVAGQDG